MKESRNQYVKGRSHNILAAIKRVLGAIKEDKMIEYYSCILSQELLLLLSQRYYQSTEWSYAVL